MLLAPFLWIFCEFDEKVFDNLPLELRDETLKRLPEDIREAYELFRWNIGQR